MLFLHSYKSKSNKFKKCFIENYFFEAKHSAFLINHIPAVRYSHAKKRELPLPSGLKEKVF
jgi:hypothetical protein